MQSTESESNNMQLNMLEKRVVVVDDQRSFQVLIKAMLQNLGFSKITLLSSAEESRKRFQKEQFDIYLIDYNLGHGENGRQLMDYLKQQRLLPVDSIIFIISGDNSRSMVLSALESEPDDYMMKPFSQEQLRLRLLRALIRKQQLLPMFVAFQSDNKQQVLVECKKIIDQNSRYASYCRCIMAEILLEQDRAQEAKKILEEGLAVRESAWLRLFLGRATQQLGDHDAAILHLHSALHLRPLMVDAYRWLAYSQMATGADEEAIATLERAVTISPQSARLHQQIAEHCLHAHDYFRAKQSLGTLLDLHRYAVDENPQILGSYVHCMILHAINSQDTFHIGNLQKQVNMALSRCRDSLINHEFDFQTFEQICQARVQMARGNLPKGKQQLYKTTQDMLDTPQLMSSEILSETILAMMQLGEFEFADQLQKFLPPEQAKDPLLTQCIQSIRTDAVITERRNQYQLSNEQGIKAFTQGDLELALRHFRDAQRKAPANTSATLNKTQVLLALCQQQRTRKDLLNELTDTLNLMDGVSLNPAQKARYEQLKKESETLLKPQKR
jgi:Response regulator containing a CheY-like receiver domain and a GGDEF domain